MSLSPPSPPSADLVLVTRQFGLRWGGAEHSIAEVLEELRSWHPGLTIAVTDGGFDPADGLRPLPLVHLVRARRQLRAAAAGLSARLVLAQSLVAPALINALAPTLPVAWFLRDVAYWDQWPNNETGIRQWAKAGYRLALAPFVARFRRESARAFRRANLLVANSAFMAERIRAVSGRSALVVFPRTPVQERPAPVGTVVAMVGENADKGGVIVRTLAQRFPTVTFRVHSRRPILNDVPGNVVAAPWERDADRLYHDVRLMLVPSQVAEAYGRVALEAQGRGVPVLVSAVGGLGANVPGDGNLWRIGRYRCPEAWCQGFEPAWAAAGLESERALVHAFARTRRRQADDQHRALVRRLAGMIEGTSGIEESDGIKEPNGGSGPETSHV